jgi:hypothetical protein
MEERNHGCLRRKGRREYTRGHEGHEGHGAMASGERRSSGLEGAPTPGVLCKECARKRKD